jgi:hypothetical protein
MIRRAAKSFRALGVVLMLLIVNTTPVAASNWGSGVSQTKPQGGHACDDTPLSECIADNGSHFVTFYNVGDPQLTATANRLSNVYDPITGVVVLYQSQQNSNTDVVVLDGFSGVNLFAGWTICAHNATYGGSDPYRWCKVQYIYYNLSHTDYYATGSRRRMIACHEVGHTLGLQHTASGGTTSCMHPTAKTSQTLRPHDVSHLEDLY